MKMIRFSAKQYELPAEGMHHAKLVEIRDLEPAVNPKGEEKERVRFVWELANEINSSSYAFRVFQTFNVSLHSQSFLSAAIRDITGSEPGKEFDLDSLLGVVVDLVLKHNPGNDGRVYCNVAAILRPNTQPEVAEEERVRAATEKVKEQVRRPHPLEASKPDPVEINDVDVPF